jgi:uncharacterized protein YbaR (Trm112 family)
MNEKLLKLLVCPQCKGGLIWHEQNQELICKADQIAFLVKDDIPVMLLTEARSMSVEEINAC